MANAPAVPIHDNHFHCRPDGWKGVDAAREFAAAGGTSIMHVRLPTYPGDVAAFQASCHDHLAFSDHIRVETGLAVWSAIGPYPLEIMQVAEGDGWEAGEAFGRACYDAAGALLADGQGHCLGEVGRAHFEGVEAHIQEHLNRLLLHGMGVAKDVGVPIMLHTEHTEPETMAEFAAMADRAGLARDRVIKHYCGPLVRDDEHHGLFPSIIAGRSNIRTAVAKHSDRWMLETDYIDEPTRPNVVMPPDTIPKRVKGFLQSGDLTEDLCHKIGSEWPTRFYGE